MGKSRRGRQIEKERKLDKSTRKRKKKKNKDRIMYLNKECIKMKKKTYK